MSGMFFWDTVYIRDRQTTDGRKTDDNDAEDAVRHSSSALKSDWASIT